MCPKLLGDAKFFDILLAEDHKEAERVRQAGCPHCGGPLHQAHFPRKVRGIGDETSGLFERRLSFCCGRCRRRQTPASLRFLGPKVYAGAAILVAAVLALQQSLSEAMRCVGAAQRTVRRWRQWFRELPKTSFWQRSAGLLHTQPSAERLPLSLLEGFEADGDCGRTLLGLRFLAPLSEPSRDQGVAF
jgi:transposase